jgi:hypothetical protein
MRLDILYELTTATSQLSNRRTGLYTLGVTGKTCSFWGLWHALANMPCAAYLGGIGPMPQHRPQAGLPHEGFLERRVRPSPRDAATSSVLGEE